jgi:transcriptional regulator with XRE-family HTH domain
MAPIKKTPKPVDVHVGARIRARRQQLSMSQEKLADAIDLTFQQVQKYEKGTNRVGASRLQQLANVLRVPVAFFFDAGPDAKPASDKTTDPPGDLFAFVASKDGVALIHSFTQISRSGLRRSIVRFVEELAGDDGAPAARGRK